MQHQVLGQKVLVSGGQDAPMPAYFAQPSDAGQYPAVIIGMELFGVTQYIRNVADRAAALGYLAIAPDFYHRGEPGVELAADQHGREKGFQLLHQVRREDAIQDVSTTMDFLKQQSQFLGKIGFLGLSVGGHIGYLAATQLDLAACAIFYAGWLTNTEIEISQPEPTIMLTPGISKHGGRILYFVGGRDKLIAPPQPTEIARALEAAHVRYEMVVYPEAQHGFFCEERGTFDRVSSEDAWKRTINLFASELPRKK